MKDIIANRLFEYVYNRTLDMLYESYDIQEEYNLDEIFKQKYDNIIVRDSLKNALASQKEVISINNKTDLNILYKRFLNNINNRVRGDLRADNNNIDRILRHAGIKTLAGFQHQLREYKVYLGSIGFKVDCIALDIKRGRKSDYVFDESCRSKYSQGEEIDIDYLGDGHEDYQNQIVLRSRHGETPIMIYGFNGRYSSVVCNEIRHIYAEDTGADYYYCSGISLKKWKKCDDVRKKCCDRNGELYE